MAATTGNLPKIVEGEYPPEASTAVSAMLGAGLLADLRDLTADSREVDRGRAFVAYPGATRDGRDFIPDAIRRGAPAVLWEPDGFVWRDEWRIPNFGIANLKSLAGEIASHVFGDPSAHLWIVGVTGTNGKTSTCQWIAECLDRLGRRSAVIGTIGQGLVGNLERTANTTPDAISLQRMLRRALDSGAAACAMEVSSHGLVQGRVGAVKFDVALLTNLTRDHLDYHGSMRAYADAKATLFNTQGLKTAVLNGDDGFGRELAARLRSHGIEIITYGIGSGDIDATVERIDTSGFAFRVRSRWGDARVESPLLGRFNVSNLLGVVGVLIASGAGLDEAAAAVQVLCPVEGRMQALGGNGRARVVVDYAHTPDALEKVLSTLRDALAPGGHLICVFGCGGDRDRGKRPEMGKVAARLADRAIVTSDNPRSEGPAAIIAEIVAGMPGGRYEIVVDRRAAIGDAIRTAHQEDIVLIAGKGHEDYQEVAGARHAFSDLAVAATALADAKGERIRVPTPRR